MFSLEHSCYDSLTDRPGYCEIVPRDVMEIAETGWIISASMLFAVTLWLIGISKPISVFMFVVTLMITFPIVMFDMDILHYLFLW
jgi:hypothetical protein